VNSKDFLYRIYTEKRSRNTNYSIRAFARDLSIPSGRLTEIFNGKRSLTEKLGTKISEKLNMPEEEVQHFLESIRLEKKMKKKTPQGQQIPLEDFEKIFSPKALALLSLMETRTFRADFGFIADRLGMSATEAEILVQSLTQHGYITISSSGRMKPVYSSTYTVEEVPAQSIRNYHKRTLQKIIDGIDQIDLKERDVTSITFAIDKTKLETAKKKIAKFQNSLMKYLETGKKTEVYVLNVQLFPVTKS